MELNKKIAVALSLTAALLSGTAGVQAAQPAEPAKNETAAQTQQAESYTYTSKEYGYTIQCPQKPNVIPARMLYEDKKGEVLIFANDGYAIQNAWVILTDAFDSKDTPDYNTIKEDEAKTYLTGLMNNNAYEGATFIKLGENRKAVFAITAKEVELDTDGDGKPDVTAKADSQMAVMFFRGEKGGCYSLQLIDNPELRESALLAFKAGAASFQEK